MKLKSIQKDYVQKSRLFLYPLLGIKKGWSIVPVQVYMTWDNMYNINDYKLITVYHLREDAEFKNFEEKMLMGNSLFDDFFELEMEEDGKQKGAYVFDCKSLRIDYKKVVNGKYSLLSEEHKMKVLKFFKTGNANNSSIMSYLRPEEFFGEVAKLLNVDKYALKKVGELCDLPDLERETLVIPKKVLTFEPITNL